MKIPFTNLHSQYIELKTNIDNAIQDCIERNSFISGPDVSFFENSIADYVGAEDCASTSSGTMSLLIALKAIGIEPGDEIITVSHTWVSTIESIVNVGAIPVMIDIDQYYLLDQTQIKSAITNKTKAILYVDLYGQTPDVDTLRSVANQHNLYLIADSAQSFGAKYKNQHIGNLADLTCVSFNPVKNLGAFGDAGCILGKKDLVDCARVYRDHGGKSKYIFDKVGYNARIDNIQAAILLAKLPRLKDWIDGRNVIAENYNKCLSGYVETPLTMKNNSHGYHVYCIQTDNRDDLKLFLEQNGVSTNIHYPKPCHVQPAFSSYSKNNLPITEGISNRILSLPCFHNLTLEQQNYIIDNIKKWKDNQV
jgi:dTDP-4-amino-4,6-dideoxygalactose transaminase